MARKFLCVYYDQEEAWNTLEDDERGRLLSALIAYAARGERPNLTGPEKYVWPIMSAQVDKNNANYAETSDKRSKAGKKSGEVRRANKQARTNVHSNEQNEQTRTNVRFVEQNEQSGTNVGNNNNNSNNSNNREFVPPTLEEVKEYIASKGNIIDADYFYEYYTNLNWHDKSGAPVRNWKNRALTWIQKEKERNPPPRTDANGKRIFKDYQDQLEHDMDWTKKLASIEDIREAYSRGGEPSDEFKRRHPELVATSN